ncbi:hypothetical protein [Lacinutrix jangbogonensis]|uniref:hypothetical protein n=1 Tax=Lacinutrix jangbogonensis TaxID=1469557 RepID=UPI00053DBDF9|nr:hypothetical protein [Lacinutrix jangbogonensis]
MKKFILVIALLAVSFTNAQNILIVDNNTNVDTTPSHMYSTFATANTAAATGDIIYVQPSATSYGNINISKEVTIYGVGHTPELNAGRRATFGLINVASNNVKISGIRTTAHIQSVSARSNITIENSIISTSINFNTGVTNASIQGNIVLGGITLHSTTSTNITITHNFFDTVAVNGLSGFNSSTIFNNNLITFAGVTTQSFFSSPIDLVAQNNIFVSTSSFHAANWQTGSSPVIFNNCLSYSYQGTTLGLLNGTGNFDNTNPQFVSIPGTNPSINVDNDYNIGSGSLGTDGNEVGLFSGSYDFDNRGYPTILPYLEEMTISNNMVQAGTHLNVNLKANANKTN